MRKLRRKLEKLEFMSNVENKQPGIVIDNMNGTVKYNGRKYASIADIPNRPSKIHIYCLPE